MAGRAGGGLCGRGQLLGAAGRGLRGLQERAPGGGSPKPGLTFLTFLNRDRVVGFVVASFGGGVGQNNVVVLEGVCSG